MRPTCTVVTGTAGTGKSVRMVREYLRVLAREILPERIVVVCPDRPQAVAFRRRVAMALSRADGKAPFLGDRVHESHLDLSDAVPHHEKTRRRALATLSSAPIGTLGDIAHYLVTEFVLDLHVTTPAGQTLPIDLPLARCNLGPLTTDAAREVIEGHGELGGQVEALVQQFPYDTLVDWAAGVAAVTRGQQVLDGADFARRLREALVAVFKEVRQQHHHLGRRHHSQCRPHREVMEQWLDGGMPDPAPPDVIRWIHHRVTSSRAADAHALMRRLEDEPLQIGEHIVSALTVVQRAGAYADPGEVEAADTLRRQLVDVAHRVHERSLELAVARRVVDDDLLINWATTLCRNPPERLRTRLSSLFVLGAEGLDSRRAQLLDAILSLPGQQRQLRTFVAGHVRQRMSSGSSSLETLIGEAARAKQIEVLRRNHRSTPDMITAIDGMFSSPDLAGIGADASWKVGTPSLSGTTSDARNWAHNLPPAHKPLVDPVAIVGPPERAGSWTLVEASDAAVDVFARRLRRVWASEGRWRDSAVVFVPAVDRGHVVGARLRMLLTDFDRLRVVVHDQGGLVSSRVTRDLAIILRALARHDGPEAWLGLWKLPPVGLTDGALALMARGVGLVGLPNPDPGFEMAQALGAEALDPQHHSAADVEAFERSLPALRAAHRSLGSRATASVLRDLSDALNWRTILAAGPDGPQRLKDFDRALEWIGTIEADGPNPSYVLRHLSGEITVPPPVGFPTDRGECVVEIGLLDDLAHREFDHVLVDMIGAPVVPDGGPPSCVRVQGAGDPKPPHDALEATFARAPLTASSDRDALLVGVELDPNRGVNPRPDFVTGLVAALGDADVGLGLLRRVYVAVTRGVRTVTFGASRGSSQGIHRTLATCWLGHAMGGVSELAADAVTPLVIPEPPRVVALRRFERVIPPGQFNGVEAVEEPSARRIAFEELVDSADVRQGERMPMPAGPDGVDLPLANLAVEWFKVGGMQVEPPPNRAAALVEGVLGRPDPEVSSWLCDLSGHLADNQPQLFELIDRADSSTAFDAPFMARDIDGNGVTESQIDLLISLPARRLWLISLVGQTAPESREALASNRAVFAALETLQAQRAALNRADYRVSGMGLLFALDSSWIGWQWDASVEANTIEVRRHTETLVPNRAQVTEAFDRRLLLHDALSAHERKGTTFSIEEIAQTVGFPEGLVAQLFERFLLHYVPRATEVGQFRSSGLSALRPEEFVEVLEGGVARRQVEPALREGLRLRSRTLFGLAVELMSAGEPGTRVVAASTLLATAVELVAVAEGYRPDTVARAPLFRETLGRLEHLRRGARLLIAEVETAAIPALVECVHEFEAIYTAGFGESPSHVDVSALATGGVRIDFEVLEGRFGEKFVEDAMRLLLDLGMKREAPTDVSRWLEEDDPVSAPDLRIGPPQPLRRSAHGPTEGNVPRFGVVETTDIPEDRELDALHPTPLASAAPTCRLLDELRPGLERHQIDIDAPWLDVLRLVPADVERRFAARGLMTLEDVIRALETDREGEGLEPLLSRRLRRDLGVIASEGLEFYLFGPAGPPTTLASLVVQWIQSLDEGSRDVAKQALLEGSTTEDLSEETGLAADKVRQIVYEALVDGARIFREVAGRLIGDVVEQLDEAGGFLHGDDALAEVTGAANLREVRFACRVAGHRDVRIWRREFLTNLSGAHRRARLERFRRALISAGRRELELSKVRVHAENSGIRLDVGRLVRLAELGFDMNLVEGDKLVVSAAKTDIVADILRDRGTPMHISDIADSYTARPDGGARTDDLAALQKGIRAQLQHRNDVYTVDSGIYVHQSALPIARNRLGSLARWCAQRAREASGRLSVQRLLNDLKEDGFDVSEVSPYLLMDVLSRHTDLTVFRNTFEVGYTAAVGAVGYEMEQHVIAVLKAARAPLTLRDILELLPNDVAASPVRVRQILEQAEWALTLSDKGSWIHVDSVGLSDSERSDLVDRIVEMLPAGGDATACRELVEALDSDAARTLLARFPDPSEVIVGLLDGDERVRVGSGHLVARASAKGQITGLLSDVVVKALGELVVASPGEIRVFVETHYGYDGSNVSLSHAFLTARGKGDILRLPGFVYCARDAAPASVLSALEASGNPLNDEIVTMRLGDLKVEELWMLTRLLAAEDRDADAQTVAGELNGRAGVPSKIRRALMALLPTLS